MRLSALEPKRNGITQTRCQFMKQDAFVNQMRKYMPEPACIAGYQWLCKHPAKLKIAKPRKTKLGDFRIRGKNQIPEISVNGDLNPYAFTVTFTHEIAHLMDYMERGNLQNPHGQDWKTIYSNLLMELLENDAFPIDLVPAVKQHIKSPKAASCSDPELLDQLRLYDDNTTLTLKELPEGATFILRNDRMFEKGELRRTRYRCIELSSGKPYLVHGQSEVKLHNS